MPGLADRLFELRQKRSKLYDEAREIAERASKDNRALTADEETRHVSLCGRDREKDPGEIFKLDQQIQMIQRTQANEGIGWDARSGQDPGRGMDIESRLSDPLPHEDPHNTKNGRHRFSIMCAAMGFLPGGGGLTGLEKEVSQALEQRSGFAANVGGFKMPYQTRSLSFKQIDAERRARDQAERSLERRLQSIEARVLNSAAGSGGIPTNLDKDWIELLRNQMVVKAAGMREIMDLKGKFAIPRQNAAATSYWVAESAAPTGSNQTLDQVLFVPHTIGAYTDISRRFFELTILDSGEEFVREDLTAILARGIDLAALNGPGNAFTPLGILQNQGITSARTVAFGTNGAAPTWAPLVELFTIVARGNANGLGPFSYVGNADVEGTLATTAKIGSTFPIYLLEDGKVYNKPFYSTQQLPNSLTKGSSGATLSPIIGGIFNQLIAAYWSGVDILVDPYTGSNTGTIRIVALQDMDLQARHNEAFSVAVDMVTNQFQ